MIKHLSNATCLMRIGCCMSRRYTIDYLPLNSQSYVRFYMFDSGPAVLQVPPLAWFYGTYITVKFDISPVECHLLDENRMLYEPTVYDWLSAPKSTVLRTFLHVCVYNWFRASCTLGLSPSRMLWHLYPLSNVKCWTWSGCRLSRQYAIDYLPLNLIVLCTFLHVCVYTKSWSPSDKSLNDLA